MAIQTTLPSESKSYLKTAAAIAYGHAVVSDGSGSSGRLVTKQATTAGTLPIVGVCASAAPATSASADSAVAVHEANKSGRVEAGAGAALALDAQVTYNAAGRFITATTGTHVSGYARSTAGADGAYFSLQLSSPGVIAP